MMSHLRQRRHLLTHFKHTRPENGQTKQFIYYLRVAMNIYHTLVF